MIALNKDIIGHEHIMKDMFNKVEKLKEEQKKVLEQNETFLKQNNIDLETIKDLRK